MSEYLNNVIRATGGHAAPAENLDEAALEKNPGDPCWEGYVQVGMKEKNGEMVPNCVPAKAAAAFEKISSVLTSDEIEEVLAHYNSNVGGPRQVGLTAAAEVAARSYDSYFDTCPTAELGNAILWELHSFLEYATLGVSTEMEVVSEHDDLLNPGHPTQGMTASVNARIDWISSAPELEESDREAIRFALSDSSSPLEAIHASTRIKALAASGTMSPATLDLVNSLIIN